MKGPSLAEVATAKVREAQRLVRLQRSYEAEGVAGDAKAGWGDGEGDREFMCVYIIYTYIHYYIYIDIIIITIIIIYIYRNTHVV